jgi:hypothetical protein
MNVIDMIQYYFTDIYNWQKHKWSVNGVGCTSFLPLRGSDLIGVNIAGNCGVSYPLFFFETPFRTRSNAIKEDQRT